MIVFSCILVTVFLAAVFVRAVRALGLCAPATTASWCLLGLVSLGTVLLVFRPDEELEAGEDAAAYFNAAQLYVRTGKLHISDPALSELSQADRHLFRYGDHRFMITKDHTLWARDNRMDPVSVFFFPAYSFLLGLPIALGFSYGAFWISSLTAIGVGVVLAGLTTRLTGRAWTGWLAYGLFLMHPAVAWNARALRAEWPASLLVLCGLALWLPGIPDKSSQSKTTGFLAGLALGSAILFHMTAVFVVIPAIVAGVMLTRKEQFYLGWWIGLLAGLALFAAQTVWVTDPYWILDNLRLASRRNVFLTGLFLLAIGSTGARWIYHRVAEDRRARVGLSLLMSLGFWGLVFLTLRFRDEHGHIPFLPSWTVAYISLTDFGGVLRTSSRVWFFFALLGMPILCLRSPLGRWLFFLLAPTSLTIGWVVNYMFETRRMVTFLVPLLILSTVVLVDWIADALARRAPMPERLKPRLAPALATLAAGFLAAAAVRGRTHIYTTWNQKGIHGFYRTLSARIATQGDFLFAEYTQSAVPIAKMTGLPLLPLAWEYRSDGEVERIESIWQTMVESHPDRRHLLVTPFEGSLVPGVAMKPLETASIRLKSLGRARRDVPRQVNRWTRVLHVTRLLPPGSEAPRIPYVRAFFGSRLGIRGDTNRMRAGRQEHEGVALDQTPRVDLAGVDRAFALVAFPLGRIPEGFEARAHRVRRVPLGPHWLLLDVTPGEAGVLELQSSEPAFLAQLFAVGEGGANPLPLPGEPRVFGLEHLSSQWLVADAAIALPLHAGESWIWTLAVHGQEPGASVSTRFLLEDDHEMGAVSLSHAWRWHPLRVQLDDTRDGTAAWVRLLTDPPHDPGLRDFPPDLGLRIHILAILPSESP